MGTLRDLNGRWGSPREDWHWLLDRFQGYFNPEPFRTKFPGGGMYGLPRNHHCSCESTWCCRMSTSTQRRHAPLLPCGVWKEATVPGDAVGEGHLQLSLAMMTYLHGSPSRSGERGYFLLHILFCKPWALWPVPTIQEAIKSKTQGQQGPQIPSG